MEKERSGWPVWRLVRDVLLFFVGLTGIAALLIHWLISGESPDEILAVIFTSMVGLPLALRKDES